MSLKDKLPDIIVVAIMSVAGGICAGVAFDQGHKRGFREGFEFGKDYERCVQDLDNLNNMLKAHKESDKKEEASK